MATVLHAHGKEYSVLNLTPHTVKWCPAGTTQAMSIQSSGQIRLTREPSAVPVDVALVMNPDGGCMEKIGPIKGTFYKARPFNGVTLSGVTEQDLVGKALIVSMPVAQYLTSEQAPFVYKSCLIMAPDTGPESAIRDGEGQIAGVQTFTIY